VNFSEAWYRDHLAKRAGQPLPANAVVVRFTLKRPTKLLNEVLRMHWRARRNYAKALSGEIAKLVGIITPMERASDTIERFSVKEPDFDGLVGGVKQLVDCLLIRSERHPHGLGLIRDDSPAHLDLIVRHCPVTTLKGQGTTVTLERLK
jgi:hypothetical protein